MCIYRQKNRWTTFIHWWVLSWRAIIIMYVAHGTIFPRPSTPTSLQPNPSNPRSKSFSHSIFSFNISYACKVNYVSYLTKHVTSTSYFSVLYIRMETHIYIFPIHLRGGLRYVPVCVVTLLWFCLCLTFITNCSLCNYSMFCACAWPGSKWFPFRKAELWKLK